MYRYLKLIDRTRTIQENQSMLNLYRNTADIKPEISLKNETYMNSFRNNFM